MSGGVGELEETKETKWNRRKKEECEIWWRII